MDIEGLLFILITMVSPLQPYFKYLKAISILQKLITVMLKSMISRVCKTKGLMTISFKG